MIDSGSLTDKVKFLSAEKKRSEFGSVDTEWAEAYRCSARVKFNKGSRAITSGDMWLPNTISVLIRYTGKVNERQRIVWDGKIYLIDSLNSSRKEGSITIVATKLNEGEDGRTSY